MKVRESATGGQEDGSSACKHAEEVAPFLLLGRARGRVRSHHVNNDGNLIESNLDPVWGEVVFRGKLAQQVGVDELMLQWLYTSCVIQPKLPGFKRYLKRLLPQLSSALRFFLKPRKCYCGHSPCDNSTKREKPIYNSGVKSHFCYPINSRIDADLVLRDSCEGTDFW